MNDDLKSDSRFQVEPFANSTLTQDEMSVSPLIPSSQLKPTKIESEAIQLSFPIPIETKSIHNNNNIETKTKISNSSSNPVNNTTKNSAKSMPAELRQSTARNKALKPLKPRAKTSKNLDFWGIESSSKPSSASPSATNNTIANNTNESKANSNNSSRFANVSLLFDPLSGLADDEEQDRQNPQQHQEQKLDQPAQIEALPVLAERSQNNTVDTSKSSSEVTTSTFSG